MAYPGFKSTGTLKTPSSKLGGSNIGANNTTSSPKGLSGSTTALGDHGTKGGIRGGAKTQPHEQFGDVTPPGSTSGRQSRGSVTGSKAGS